MSTWYTDSSALLKLVARDAESASLTAHVAEATLVASTLVLAEVPRALSRRLPEASWRRSWEDVLARTRLVDVDRPLVTRSSDRRPPELRTLDAIHLESALTVSAGLDGVLVYDRRLAQACRDAGLVVASPGQQA